ncbi:hypothetical protein B0J11DRAFT_577984 [Dendryphion nanum]|uniref:Uncharacterized protein n=1 Tax=Dendryphion nanum TaxID=256645 RepID=A0A9P9E5R9_9PLEO|nr:hypothetical protein B0J11DRAFT_577984 [Dendryphion nanum]
MGLVTPPPSHTRVSPLPSRTLRAQWCILENYLHTLPLSENQASKPTWLRTIAPTLLLLALDKRTAELEILQYEISSSNKPDPSRVCSLEFPNYDVGTPRSWSLAAAQTTQATRSTGQEHNIPNFQFKPRISDLYIQPPGSSDQPPSTQPFNLSSPINISPLSPTFGPRKGHIPTGTVARRRSLSQAVPRDTHTASAANAEGGSSDGMRGDEFQRRLQWEAAWVWIERNLEEYVRKFEGKDGDEGRKDVWEELIRVMGEGERLRRG